MSNLNNNSDKFQRINKETTKYNGYITLIEQSVNDKEFDKMLQKDTVLRDTMKRLRQMGPGLEQVQAVNDFWNKQAKGVDDKINYGIDDYAAKASETWKRKKADCEDYAIAKYTMLRKLGYAEDDMQVMLVKKQKTSMFDPDALHAILSVNVDGEDVILDNLRPNVRKAKDVFKGPDPNNITYFAYAGINEKEVKEYLDNKSIEMPTRKNSSKFFMNEKDKMNELESGFMAESLKNRILNPNQTVQQTPQEIFMDSYAFGELFVPEKERKKFHEMPRNNEYYALVEKYANEQIQKSHKIIEKESNKNTLAKLKEKQEFYERNVNDELARMNSFQKHKSTANAMEEHSHNGRKIGNNTQVVMSDNDFWRKVHPNATNKNINEDIVKIKNKIIDKNVRETIEKGGVDDRSVFKLSDGEKMNELHKNRMATILMPKMMGLPRNETLTDSLIFSKFIVPEKEQEQFKNAVYNNPDKYNELVSNYHDRQMNRTLNIRSIEADQNFIGKMQDDINKFSLDMSSKGQIAKQQLHDIDEYANMAQKHMASCKQFQKEQQAPEQKSGISIAMDM